MKCTIPEISWHNRDPVLSIDIQPTKNAAGVSPYRLATGGTDSHVVLWYVTVKECGLASVEVAADLQRHQRAVNTVRFSPSGQYLASGDDESVIIVWKPKTEHDISDLSSTDTEVSKEQWISMKMLRGHLEDVYDICWSLDSTNLISGSIDNTAIVWDVQKGRNLGILSGHGGFVQGVAWDPKNKYVATLSSDRTCRIHNILTKKLTAKIGKTTLPVPPGTELDGKTMRLFHDDTLKSFFRRLSFSPDGELLIVPSGVIEIPNTEKHINTTYIFTRYDFSRPVVYLPSPHEYTVAVRFCPLLFQLHEGSSLFALPYRMVFAVATKSNVILYDTQQPEPIAFISNIHYTRLTDLSWSSDGRVLVASSTDGYCSIITFSEKELGDIYEPFSANTESEIEFQSSENTNTDISSQELSHKSSVSVTENCTDQGYEEENVVPDADELNAKISVKRHIPLESEVKELKTVSNSVSPVSKSKTPRRVPLITLSSPRKYTSSSEPLLNRSSVQQLPISHSDIEENKVKNHSKEVYGCDSKESFNAHSDSLNVVEMCLVERNNIESSIELMQTERTNAIDSNERENQGIISEKEEKENASVNKIATASKETAVAGDGLSHQETGEPMEVDVTPGPKASNLIEEEDVYSKNISLTVCPTNSKIDISTCSSNVSSEEKHVARKEEILSVNNEMNTEDNMQNQEYHKKSPRKKKSVENSSANEKSPARDSCAEFQCETTPSKCLVKVKQSEEASQIGTSNGVKSSDESRQEVQCNVTPVENRTPRRVQFITISSPKSKKKIL